MDEEDLEKSLQILEFSDGGLSPELIRKTIMPVAHRD